MIYYYNSNVLNNEEENKKMIQKINDIKLDSVSINFKCLSFNKR